VLWDRLQHLHQSLRIWWNVDWSLRRVAITGEFELTIYIVYVRGAARVICDRKDAVTIILRTLSLTDFLRNFDIPYCIQEDSFPAVVELIALDRKALQEFHQYRSRTTSNSCMDCCKMREFMSVVIPSS